VERTSRHSRPVLGRLRIIDIDPQDRVALGAWVNAQEEQIA
jgi:hypothetical protein